MLFKVLTAKNLNIKRHPGYMHAIRTMISDQDKYCARLPIDVHLRSGPGRALLV